MKEAHGAHGWSDPFGGVHVDEVQRGFSYVISLPLHFFDPGLSKCPILTDK